MARLCTLTIARTRFTLATNVDLRTLMKRIDHAVRSGGEMIRIPVVETESVLALVSPALSVVLRTPGRTDALIDSTEVDDSVDEDGSVGMQENAAWGADEFELGAFA